MKTSVALQLLGPVSLFGVMAMADGAAYALNCAPSSEWLWYFNLKVLALFQQSHYALDAAFGADAQILIVGTPLLILAGLGVAYRRTLLLATSSNLSLAYVVFVALSWARAKAPLQASLSVQYAASTNSELILLTALVSLCLLSFAVSHVIYLQKTMTHAA